MSPNLEELLVFLRFPSISTQSEHKEDLQACAGWLADILRQAGLNTHVEPTPGHPAVLAWSDRNPNLRTVLIYGHYDVQPPDPLAEWNHSPFEPAIKDNVIYARGATDNKGQIFAHVVAASQLLKSPALPVNLIFLIEGEEEIGSPNLTDVLERHRDLLACDIILISDTMMVAHNYPTLTYSLRGIATMEIRLTGPSHDLHSGVFGGAVCNPATALVQLLASLHDKFGHVRIEGFYDDVRPPFDWERDETSNLPIDDDSIRRLAGVPGLFGEPGYSAIERIGFRPTAEINGIGGGYQGEGSKTIIPKEAFAKISFRLVPHQKPQEILALAKAHFEKKLPPGVAFHAEFGHSGEPYYVDPHSKFASAAKNALQKVFNQKPALLREGGSIPILPVFRKTLGADALLLALASPDCNAHAPNENFPILNFENGIRLSRTVLEEIGRLPR